MRVLSVISAALLGLLLLASPSSARSAADFQDSVHSLTNGIRLDHDEVKLREKSCVQKYAVRQAKKMANAGEMFHQDLAPVVHALRHFADQTLRNDGGGLVCRTEVPAV